VWVHDYVLSALMIFFFNWKLCFLVYKDMLHLIQNFIFYVWGWCILYVNHVAETWVDGARETSRPIKYGLAMREQREGEGFIPFPYYCSDPRTPKECRPSQVLWWGYIHDITLYLISAYNILMESPRESLPC